MLLLPYQNMIEGTWTLATLPTPILANTDKIAYVSDRPGSAGFMECLNGQQWIPCRRRTELYSGNTDASGNFSINYWTAFPSTPMIFPQITSAADTETSIKPSVESASGFTVNAFRRSMLTVLGINLLSFGTSPVTSLPVRVLVIEA